VSRIEIPRELVARLASTLSIPTRFDRRTRKLYGYGVELAELSPDLPELAVEGIASGFGGWMTVREIESRLAALGREAMRPADPEARHRELTAAILDRLPGRLSRPRLGGLTPDSRLFSPHPGGEGREEAP
jgi:hypothetical protein